MTTLAGTEVTADWCGVCGTRHSPVHCLGEVLATEPERHVWRAAFVTPKQKREIVGVLLARCDRGWRARVLTYPRKLWTAPGTACTVKFVGETPREAEREARKFIEEHCAQRGYRVADEPGSIVPMESFSREQTQHAEGLDASRRRVCELPVRFALGKEPPVEGLLVAASARGLFVASDVNASIGDPIRIQAELDGLSVVISGEVRTLRSEAQGAPGRPQGLGIGLTNPPARYVSYVRRLA